VAISVLAMGHKSRENINKNYITCAIFLQGSYEINLDLERNNVVTARNGPI